MPGLHRTPLQRGRQGEKCLGAHPQQLKDFTDYPASGNVLKLESSLTTLLRLFLSCPSGIKDGLPQSEGDVNIKTKQTNKKTTPESSSPGHKPSQGPCLPRANRCTHLICSGKLTLAECGSQKSHISKCNQTDENITELSGKAGRLQQQTHVPL